jgi:hypothetical protein
VFKFVNPVKRARVHRELVRRAVKDAVALGLVTLKVQKRGRWSLSLVCKVPLQNEKKCCIGNATRDVALSRGRKRRQHKGLTQISHPRTLPHFISGNRRVCGHMIHTEKAKHLAPPMCAMNDNGKNNEQHRSGRQRVALMRKAMGPSPTLGNKQQLLPKQKGVADQGRVAEQGLRPPTSPPVSNVVHLEAVSLVIARVPNARDQMQSCPHRARGRTDDGYKSQPAER